jgi:hypothetical protein
MLPAMNLIGDLERLFATSLYPLRVPIAIGLVLGLVAIVAIAGRRGWFAAARRHPRRSGALAAIALALGLPIAWYLASPLFIRTELIEPLPVALADPSPAATATPDGSTPASGTPKPSVGPDASAPTLTAGPEPTPTPEPSVFAPSTHARGVFHGADDFHFGEGTASIIETEPGLFTLRFDDFSVRNGPDLYVYLSPDPDGYADGALELGTLRATDGAFGYELPNGTDPADFASAVIWCKQFAVLFAVAPLDPA